MNHRRVLAYSAVGAVAAEALAFGGVLAWFWLDWHRHAGSPAHR